MGLVKLIPLLVLTSAIGTIIELGPLSSMSMAGNAFGSVTLLFNRKSDFLLIGDGDRDDDSLVSSFFADGGESSFSNENVSLKFSMS